MKDIGVSWWRVTPEYGQPLECSLLASSWSTDYLHLDPSQWHSLPYHLGSGLYFIHSSLNHYAIFPLILNLFFFFFQGPIQPGYFNFHTISWNSCKYNFSILLHLLEKYFNFLWWFQYRLFLQVMDEERTINCAQLWSLAIPIQHFFHLSWCVVLASETLPEKSVSMAQPGFGIHVVPSTQSFLARMGHSWSVAVVR